MRAPLGTSDFSSYLIQAKSSGAKVIGFANAGTDLQNCIKQSAEFGLAKGGQRLATLLMFITDVNSLGQPTCEGLVLTNSFYWDLTDQTRAWTKRYVAKMGTPPCMLHAGNYAAATHWLKAVKAAGTLDSDTVAAKMHAMPVNDFYHDNVRIEPNGRVEDTMYVWQVKPRPNPVTSGTSTSRWRRWLGRTPRCRLRSRAVLWCMPRAFQADRVGPKRSAPLFRARFTRSDISASRDLALVEPDER